MGELCLIRSFLSVLLRGMVWGSPGATSGLIRSATLPESAVSVLGQMFTGNFVFQSRHSLLNLKRYGQEIKMPSHGSAEFCFCPNTLTVGVVNGEILKVPETLTVERNEWSSFDSLYM